MPDAEAPSMRPWVSIFLAIANVAAFGWSMAAGAPALGADAEWMLGHGGNYGPVTFDGEQWRLLTSMFLHYGALHLVMNMIGLLDGGRHVERMYGHLGFLALYLVSGLAGSLASGVRGQAVSAGASGAVFGIFGAFAAFLVLHRGRLDKQQVSHQARGLLIFLAYNVWIGMSVKGIDMMAHVGGLVGGFVCGIALELGTDERPSTLRRSLAVLVAGTAVVIAAAFVAPRPTNSLATLIEVEKKLLGRWNDVMEQAQAGALDDDKVADVIENELLPPWKTAHEAYRKDGGEPALLDYMTAREDGWAMIAKGLRTGDGELTQKGIDRFNEGNAVLEQARKKP